MLVFIGRPKETKLYKDQDGNVVTYIEDCVLTGKIN